MTRPMLSLVWERTFATEDEADEAYEQFLEHLDKHPLEVDRFDGFTIRVYVDTQLFESQAQLVEARMEPPTTQTPCKCGHAARTHEGEDAACKVPTCACRSYERNGERHK